MSKKVKMIILTAVVLMSCLAPSVSAQVTGVLQAIAVVAPALTVDGTSALDFETVVPGVDKAVDKATAEAGEFTVAGGSAGAEVQLSFVLPTELASGTDVLPVAFTTTDVAYATDVLRTQSPPTAIANPFIVTTATLAADGGMTIWIGGEVTPTPVQPAGNYSANVELTITLTGN